MQNETGQGHGIVTAVAPDARCMAHPFARVVSTCSRCGDFLCGTCLTVAEGGECLARRTRSLSPPRAAPDELALLVFGFSGRISRRIYWLSMVGIPLGCLTLSVLGSVGFVLLGEWHSVSDEQLKPMLAALFALALWPVAAVHAKRWHDRNRSGWWTLLALVPLVGFWVYIECGFLKGSTGPNRFGADPLAPPATGDVGRETPVVRQKLSGSGRLPTFWRALWGVCVSPRAWFTFSIAPRCKPPSTVSCGVPLTHACPCSFG